MMATAGGSCNPGPQCYTLQMNSAPAILAAVSGLLFVLAIFKPAWPLCAVGGFILAVAVFVLVYK